jgi:leader peptidase (prepilin peptidase)/N-methyltransferase
MSITTLMVATASGAALGSAAGSAFTRWPIGATVSSPARSRCEGCHATVPVRDLIPVMSWVLLRGRCRSCGTAIDGRLVLLEGASAVAAMGVVHVHGMNPRAALLLIGAVAVMLATMTDLADRTIPDRLTYPLAVVAVAGMVLLSEGAARRWIVVGCALGIPLMIELTNRAAVIVGWRRSVGGGDVKLLIGLLALSFVSRWGPARLLVLALLLGGIHAAGGLLLGRLRLGDRVPFAPAIAIAFLGVVATPEATFPMSNLMEVLT